MMNGSNASLSAVFSSILALTAVAVGTHAYGAERCSGEAHVRHVVTVSQNATCVLSKLYEPDSFCLMGADGMSLVGAPFDVNPGTPATFAMTFYDGADFNMEYGLTCVAKDGAPSKSPKVIFTIGASGPGSPVVSLIGRDGGVGTWSIDGDEFHLDAQL